MRADAREAFARDRDRDTIGASLLGGTRDIHADIRQVVIIHVVDSGKVWILIKMFCDVC